MVVYSGAKVIFRKRRLWKRISWTESAGFRSAKQSGSRVGTCAFYWTSHLSPFLRGVVHVRYFNDTSWSQMVLEHDPEKLADFSDKIMRQNKEKQSAIDSI